MNIGRHMLLLTAFLALIIIPGFDCLLADQPSTKATIPYPYLWLNVGVGLGSYGGAAGLNLSLQPVKGQALFTLRYCFTADVDTDIHDVALLVGYSLKRAKSLGYVSMALGISYVGGSHNIQTLGVPMEIQLFYTPLSFAGIGLQGFANLNTEKSFYGILLCLQIGKLR